MYFDLYQGLFEIISGDCSDADKMSLRWADEKAINSTMYSADWRKNKLAAGPIRNQQMIDQNPDLVIAFKTKEKSKGTDDLLERALKKKIVASIYYGIK